MAYTKLFSSIVTSTIWVESDRTRIVWITMLAVSDKNGEVQASIPGLARIAGVPVEDCEKALQVFLSPDPYSRTPDDQGRRIEKIDGGWALLNHAKYRSMASKEDEKRDNAERQKRHREKDRRNGKVTESNAPVTHRNGKVTENRDIADADADADADARKEAPTVLVKSASPFAPPAKIKNPKPAKDTKTDEQWIADISVDPVYEGIHVRQEWGKMARWCEVNRKQPTRKRFINWLSRIEKPMTISSITPVRVNRTQNNEA